MKNLFIKYRPIFMALAIIPVAAFLPIIGRHLDFDKSTISSLQLIFLSIQVSCLLLMVKYRNEP